MVLNGHGQTIETMWPGANIASSRQAKGATTYGVECLSPEGRATSPMTDGGGLERGINRWRDMGTREAVSGSKTARPCLTTGCEVAMGEGRGGFAVRA